ncbi:hypothetical protein M8C21_007488 [Ambrosia artemisiifolia]|uniref:TNase-like domain-containing protein n=1 Tax=Ambrosia artemisiifolia TaxID=4212 RepID=A0AAD5D0Y8_AMBAR|nr:hypothetical protein M8C21_007488 [Ambrosia artemisiifolia]
MSKRLCVEMTAKGEPAGDGVSDSTDCGAALPENNPESVADPLAALEDDITKFETESKVPLDLAWHVFSDEEIYRLWFKGLSSAWKKSKPKDLEEATRLVYDTLYEIHCSLVHHDDLEGFLHFYGLPPSHLVIKPEWYNPISPAEAPRVAKDAFPFRLLTLPVVAQDVVDGVCFTVSVEFEDITLLPLDLLATISERCKALANGDDYEASKLMKKINSISRDYGVRQLDDVELVVKKYTIKLSGVRAPKIGTDDGIKARNELAKMLVGKSLTISVNHFDEEMRYVGDVYYNRNCLKETLLNKGAALCWGWEKEPLQ